MKRNSTLLLQTVILFVGIGALAFLLGEPHFEGRNVGATLFQIYFQDLFLAYAYLASIPFFVALYHAFKIAGSAGKDQLISQKTVKALRTIKNCALATIGLVALGEALLLLGESDDRAGGVFIGVLIVFGSIVAAVLAAKFERKVELRRSKG